MQVRVSARNTTVKDRDHDLIVEKVERLSKYLPGMDRAEVHFIEQRNPRAKDRKQLCEVTLQGHGHHVRVTTNGPDHVTAVDLAIEKAANQLRKLKTRLTDHRSHRDMATVQKLRGLVPTDSANGSVAVVDEEADNGLEPEYRIVKTKTVERLVLTPMDAALRMDLVDHGFYFFTNADTGRAAVLYRREDGDIGLIDEAG